MKPPRPVLVLSALLAVVVAACGGSTTSAIELVSAPDAASIIADKPRAVILDVRTPEEFNEGHIAGAVNIDFYAADFADRIAALDRNQDYVLYCRSGNRSGETAKLMTGLDFTAVDEIDGGVLAWTAAGLALTPPG